MHTADRRAHLSDRASPGEPVIVDSTPSRSAIVAELLARHGRTYAQETGIDVARATPAPLFQLLVLSILMSARIRASAAVSAARALFDEGWTTPRKMADSTWAKRTSVLNKAGYARYDESTSRMLGETVSTLLDAYGGDLRSIREEAGRDRAREHELLQRFKGIGALGADIFLREVQIVWPEVEPHADARTLDTAGSFGLPQDAAALRGLVDDVTTFARLIGALGRSRVARDIDDVLAAAGER